MVALATPEAHAFARPFDLPSGETACLLPWQRDVIRQACGSISAAVRPRRGDAVRRLTLVGQKGENFALAKQMAEAFVAENRAAGISSLRDVPQAKLEMLSDPFA